MGFNTIRFIAGVATRYQRVPHTAAVIHTLRTTGDADQRLFLSEYLYIVERRHRFYMEYVERILKAARGRPAPAGPRRRWPTAGSRSRREAGAPN